MKFGVIFISLFLHIRAAELQISKMRGNFVQKSKTWKQKTLFILTNLKPN